MATPAPAVPKVSFLDKLSNFLYLPYVLKILGVGLFALAFIGSWHQISFLHKFEIFAGVAAWIVGERFSKIYK